VQKNNFLTKIIFLCNASVMRNSHNCPLFSAMGD